MNALLFLVSVLNKVGKKDQELFIYLIVYYPFFHFECFFSLIAEMWTRVWRKLLINYK